jgi:DNA-binding response OmpR family regulator
VDRFHAQAAVIDVKLQDGDGFALGRELRQTHPDLKIVFASGHADPGNLATGFAFLQKPFETSELVAKFAELCAGELR